MQPLVHTGFDILAVALALLSGWLVHRWRLATPLHNTVAEFDRRYFLFLALGTSIGAWALGSANLYLSDQAGLGRSILGALLGATVAVEVYKQSRGIRGSTGYIYIMPLCVAIIVGRLGCFFSGADDFTYGTPASLPFAHDFGDGVLRHPVQLYEALAMTAFLAVILLLLARRPRLLVNNGFYLFTGFYATQRFAWEFFKPYAPLVGPLNLFHLACLGLLAYSLYMLFTVANGSTTENP